MIIDSSKDVRCLMYDVRSTKFSCCLQNCRFHFSPFRKGMPVARGSGLSLRMLKNTLIEATKAGAAEIVRFFNTDFKITNKEGINNPVTEADHASEKAIFDVIKSEFPGSLYFKRRSRQYYTGFLL